MERVVAHSVGLFKTVPNVVACPENRRGKACMAPNGKSLARLSKGYTNWTRAVPDRQGAYHAHVVI
jgi:hypothetical protein